MYCICTVILDKLPFPNLVLEVEQRAESTHASPTLDVRSKLLSTALLFWVSDTCS